MNDQQERVGKAAEARSRRTGSERRHPHIEFDNLEPDYQYLDFEHEAVLQTEPQARTNQI